MNRALEWLLDVIFPPKCPFCQRVLDDPRAPVCGRCQGELPWLAGEARERKVEFTDGCLSPLAYRGAVPESIHRYKFPGNPGYAPAYGLLVAQCVADSGREPPQVVTWAPLSRRRKRRRGFDQGEAMARAAARALGLPAEPLLEKRRDAGPQSRLKESAERRANVLGAYRLRPGADVAGLRVLLVDDVVTSGATLGECARVLREAGAAQVLCATLAQARPE